MSALAIASSSSACTSVRPLSGATAVAIPRATSVTSSTSWSSRPGATPESMQPASHPVRPEGQACRGAHQPFGSTTDSTLRLGSTNHAAHEWPMSATPSTVVGAGASYSSTCTPASAQIGHRDAHVGDSPRHLRLGVGRADRAARDRRFGYRPRIAGRSARRSPRALRARACRGRTRGSQPCPWTAESGTRDDR